MGGEGGRSEGGKVEEKWLKGKVVRWDGKWW